MGIGLDFNNIQDRTATRLDGPASDSDSLAVAGLHHPFQRAGFQRALRF